MSQVLELPDGFRLDIGRVLVEGIGPNGLELNDIRSYPGLDSAIGAMKVLREEGRAKAHSEPVFFTRLPYQDTGGDHLQRIQWWGRNVRQTCFNVVSLGIGGSYLGNQVLVEALKGPFWNERASHHSEPRIFYSGNNVDPVSVASLTEVLHLNKTMFLVISKSGTTTETMAAFFHFYESVRAAGLNPADHFTVVTDPEKGILLDIARQDGLPTFVVPHGVGGRWSVLTDVGLLLAAAAGIDIENLLAGARSMDEACANEDVLSNPAYLYAVVCTLLYRRKGIDESVLMPYCDSLRSLALWYVQLLAESLGKETDREGNIVNEGRTPIPALGTTDMHAQTQQHREGKRNKLVTTIAVRDFGSSEITLTSKGDLAGKLPFLANRSFSELLDAARQANEGALAADGRPSCCVSIPRLTPYTLGQLLYFFELATAFEGELLNVNAFDQPGVEHYKRIMRKLLQGS